MAKKRKNHIQDVEPGMRVEADRGDLGEEDISPPIVTSVERDKQSQVKNVVVKKGKVFKKTLDVPADRIQSTEQAETGDRSPGKVNIAADKREVSALSATGEETLAPENSSDLLRKIEEEIPTAEGLRKLESSGSAAAARRGDPEIQKQEDAAQVTREDANKPAAPQKKNFLLHVLGPGFLAGMAGNDSSAVAAYSVNGATNGYGHLWLLLLSTPLLQSVQFACAKIGRLTQKGFAEILREHYSRKVALPASLILVVANIALIAADLVAVSSGLELFTGLSWVWFVVPVGILLWYLTVYRSFNVLKKIFIAMSLAFAAYLVTALFSRANWLAVLFNTFVPHLSFSFVSISSAVALLGATISPYTMFWQVQGEKEEARAGSTKQKVRGAALDIAIGVISGNLVAYFIIVCTSATLFTHHKSIATATDAARSLEPLLGPFAQDLFAIGLIGAGLIAIPVLLASTSYAVTGTFGWPAALSKKPWQSEGFYLILTGAMAISLLVALLRFNPIHLMVWANVLNGVLSPILVIYLLIMGNNREIMRKQTLGTLTNFGLAVTALVMIAAAIMLFWGLASGQGG